MKNKTNTLKITAECVRPTPLGWCRVTFHDGGYAAGHVDQSKVGDETFFVIDVWKSKTELCYAEFHSPKKVAEIIQTTRDYCIKLTNATTQFYAALK